MSRLRTTALLALTSMFLIAPIARGYSPEKWPASPEPSEPTAAWQQRMFQACVGDFRTQFVAWSRLGPDDGSALANTLCAQARVYWPFVEMRDNQRFEQIAGLIPRTTVRPLILGLNGGPARVSSEVLQALRHSLYPTSSMLWRWTEDLAAFRAWLRSEHGGRLGGVIYVEIDGATRDKVTEQMSRARRAIEFVNDAKNNLGGFTLVVDVRVAHPELMAQLAVDDWIRVAAADCQILMASGAQ